MAYDVPKAARLASEKQNIEPHIVLEIDGVSTLYGAAIIKKVARIGDPNLLIGDDWQIGGTIEIEDQDSLITLDSGTTTSITQKLEPDRGNGSSISSMTVSLVDIDGEAAKLVSPGVKVDDALGRKAIVYLGFKGTAFPEDYMIFFRGIIDGIDTDAGVVKLNLAHPDTKKRQTLFGPASSTLTTEIPASGYAYGDIKCADTSDFIYPATTFDGNVTYNHRGARGYVKIDDEIFEYSGLRNQFSSTPTNTSLFGMKRAQFGSVAAAHAIGAKVEKYMYRLTGNVIDLALKLMLSDEEFTPYIKDVVISKVVTVVNEPLNLGVGEIHIFDSNFAEKFGVSVGDHFRIKHGSTITYPFDAGLADTGVSSNFITAIETTDEATILTVNLSLNLLANPTQPLTLSLRSQYNTLGFGLGMTPDEVDIDEHLKIKRLYLSGFDVDLYIKDEENLKELIEKELYLVAGAWSLPRKGKSSIGMHIGPVPDLGLQVITKSDAVNPDKLSVNRSINKNMYNTVVYLFDEAHNEDRFLSYANNYSADSLNRIPIGIKAFRVQARGLRSALNGTNLAIAAANRRLNRYKFGAESISNLEIAFAKGFRMEIGDVFLFDARGLNLLNSKLGNRNPEPKFYEIINKSIDFKTGKCVFQIVDTNYSTQNRYGRISPSSRIKTGLSQTKFIVEQWNPESIFGTNEGKKWAQFLTEGRTIGIKVRSADFTTRFFQTTIKSVVGNTVEVNQALGFVPQAGDWLEFADYDFAGTTALQKALYVYMRDTDFADGGDQYRMI